MALLYHSVGRGPRHLEIIPDSVIFKGGQLYLLGETSLSPEQVMLRLERIARVTPLNRPTPNTPKKDLVPVVVRFRSCRVEAVPQLTGLLHKTSVPEDSQQSLVTLSGENTFLLTQELLESGLLFDIVEPTSFRHQIHAHLKSMQALYDDVS